MKTYTNEEVLKHNKIDDCWIIIYNKIFDITNFMKKNHSGGFMPLSVAGMDATNLFIATHPSYVHKFIDPDSAFYKENFIGEIKNKIIYDNNLYDNLKLEVEEYMKEKKLKQRDIKMFDFEIITFIILTYLSFKLMIESKSPKKTIRFSILHGIFFTFMITRTIHDCNHGGLTKKNKFKRYLFTFVNEIFSTNQSWTDHHNAHHMHTNDINRDPDTNQLFRLSYKKKLKKRHKSQHIWSFPIYLLYVFSEVLGLRRHKSKSPEPVHKRYRPVAKGVLLLYLNKVRKAKKFKYLTLSYIIASIYTTLIFTVSHNQEHLSNDNKYDNNFLRHQLQTTTDFNGGSKLANFLSHGLNHQTIHHLFPSINYRNYTKLTNDVLIPFCKRNNLNYNNKGFFKLLGLHIKSLYNWRKNK